jgi:hypothetical protein
MRKFTSESGLTLAEVLIAMAGSVIVLGALTAGAIGLQKSFHASESYADSTADERRLIDYVARDLRRAIGLATGAPDGSKMKLTTGAVNLDTGIALVITLPAYYQSNDAADGSYDQPLPIVAAGDNVAYGTLAGPAPGFTVTFRKLFLAGEGSMCFVREEGDTRQVIVRGAENLQVQITVAADGESCTLVAQFISPYSQQQTAVAVHDEIMLRNARLD